MTNPNTPVQASFPIPPPAPNLPFVTLDPMGEFILTPPAFSFLQELWAAIQGQGGVIDGIDGVAISVGSINANVLALLAGQGAALTHLVPPQNPLALIQHLLSTIVLNEVPAGAVDGANTVFTLARQPTSSGVVLTLNGLQQQPGVDYALATNTITMAAAPPLTTIVMANYNY